MTSTVGRATTGVVWTVDSATEADTCALGAALARCATPGTVVALVGGLGAGKTVFAQGVGDGLGVHGPIVSPTFIVVAEYEGRLPFLHADAYRLVREDLPGVGIEEAIATWKGVAVIEWADRFPVILPADRLHVEIEPGDENARTVRAGATGPLHEATLEAWRREWDHVR